MKKLFVAVFGVLFFAPVVFADNWGVGLKLGVAENDPKGMKDAYDSYYMSNRELDENASYFGIEVLHEWDLDDSNKIGAKIGFTGYGENELKIFGLVDAKEETYEIPLTVYYKKDNGVQNWSYFVGAGASYLHTKLDVNTDSLSKSKIIPHIDAGLEYRFTEVFALGVDARYNFAAKLKKNGFVISDRSGFGAALTGRFYF